MNDRIHEAQGFCNQATLNGKYGGIVYRYVHKLTGKSYIGQTVRPIARHKQHSCAPEQSAWHNAVRKYGIDSFKYTVLDFVEAETPQQLRAKLCELEWSHIQEFHSLTTQNGYNIREFGQNDPSSDSCSKKAVDMYDLEGHFIQTFDSIVESLQFCNISGPQIRKVCNHIGQTAGGYLWAWHGEPVIVPENSMIGQYDANGKFIMAHKNTYQAALYYHKSPSFISLALRDKHRMSLGSYWRKYVADYIPMTDFPKAVFAYTLEGNFYKSYINLQAAVKDICASGTSAICAAISRRTAYHGYLWRKEYAVKINPFEGRKIQNISISATWPDGTVKHYSSIKAASLYTRIPIDNIRRSCENKPTNTSNIKFRRNGKLCDTLKDGLINVQDVSDKTPVRANKIAKMVDQYAANGTFIQTFNSISQAQKSIGPYNISSAILTNSKAGGYYWARHGSPLPESITQKFVYQYDSNGNFVAAHANLVEAAHAVGMTAGNHVKACIKDQWRRAKGYYWRKEKVNKIEV